jgi:hypothetical protein
MVDDGELRGISEKTRIKEKKEAGKHCTLKIAKHN